MSTLFASWGAVIHSLSSPRSPHRVPVFEANSNPALLAFESEVSFRLEQLKSTDATGYLSIEWLCQAMEMVLSTHASAEAFAPELQHDATNSERKWIYSFLDNSIKLLDTCVILKAAVAEIKSYCGHLKVALRALEKEPLGEVQLKRCMKALNKCMDALKRRDDAVNHLGHRRTKLENCSSMLRRMGERLNMEDASKGNSCTAIHTAQIITIFVYGLLSSALSLKPRRSISSISIDGHSSWSFSLINLQQRVKEHIEKKKSRGSNAFLEELDMADIAVRNFHALLQEISHGNSSSEKGIQVLKVTEGSKALQALLMDLQQGIHAVESHLENTYKNLLRSRMAFLDMELGS
ncbi:hypothetical protein KP509_22G032000 [Ceratopteris richardii]|uniref:Uncharacterized protein n=2 Tax=Ceratopteris richardii TaxID=49495 RepID=A0A8T2S725_CERRI|nr:hypothetical protein KP509_22G032000 [Ceratopteris richardii]